MFIFAVGVIVYDEENEGYPSYKRNTQSYERRRQRSNNGAIYENINTNSSERQRVGQVDVHDVDVHVQDPDTIYANMLPNQQHSAQSTSSHAHEHNSLQQPHHSLQQPHHSLHQPRDSRTSAFKPGDEENITAMFDNVLRLAQEEDHMPVHNLRQQMSSRRSPGPDVNKNNVRVARQGSHHHHTPHQHSPQPPPPRAVVQPLIQNRSPLPEPETGTFKSASSGSSSILSVEDVPHDLSSMSVDDVGSCLCLLNMDQHVTEFNRYQIDGHLLGDMRENVLQNEFRFTPFNASKLMRFVRGWRPKVN